MLVEMWYRNLKEGNHLEDLVLDGTIVYWILKVRDIRISTGFIYDII